MARAGNLHSIGAGVLPPTMSELFHCADFEAILAEVLKRADLPETAQQHVAACRSCAALLEDFEAIAESVRQLPPESPEPVPDLWPQIREVLRREGVIHANRRECAPTPQLVRREPVSRG